ncbi:hypothetical protein D3C84_701300 [compost metagenome]
MVTGLSCFAARVLSKRPTGTEPVKETLRVTGEAIRRSETWPGSPNSMLITPLGTPASTKARMIPTQTPGVSSAGLTTTEQPAASAAATLRATSTAGKFHGAKAATGPIGRLTVVCTSSGWRGGSRRP